MKTCGDDKGVVKPVKDVGFVQNAGGSCAHQLWLDT